MSAGSPEHVRTLDGDKVAATPASERVVERLISSDSGATTCTVSWVRTPSGGGSPEGRHVHDVDQHFYLLAGVMSFDIDGDEFEAGPNSLVVFPAGVPHRNWNAGTDPTVHLVINAPVPDPSQPFARPAP